MRKAIAIVVCAGCLTAGEPWQVEGKANLLVFVAPDCPVSNTYAPEMRRICGEYRERGIECHLIYTGGPESVREHQLKFGLENIRAISDPDHEHAKRAGATVTPEAVIVRRDGGVLYRGRIDNRYLAWSKPRPRATDLSLRRALDEVVAGKPVSEPRTKAIGCYIPFSDIMRPTGGTR